MILITGGMGFIGLHTARAMLDAGEDVVITYYQTWREPDFIKDEFGGRVQVEKVDVTDREALLALGEKHDITSICHLAVTGLGAFDAIGDMRVNLNGLMNVMEAGVQWGVSRVSLASSIAIYSSVAEGPFKEDIPLPIYATGNPTETYKKTFEIGSAATLASAPTSRSSTSASAASGARSTTRWPTSRAELVHAAVNGVDPNLAAGRGGVPFSDDLADFCYVKDCGNGISMVHNAESLPHKTYNISSGRGAPNQELVDSIKEVIPDAQLVLQPGSGPAARKDPYGDLTQIKADVGYEPQFTLQSAVVDYINWLRAGNDK